MRKFIILLFMIGLVTISNLLAQGKLEVTVKNIKDLKGSIRVSLFNSEKDFLEKILDRKVVTASANEVTVVFEKLKPGEYAVSVIHDLNDNNVLDKGFMGIPKEPYGFSNNARGQFGPASYESSKFVVKGDVKISINVE